MLRDSRVAVGAGLLAAILAVIGAGQMVETAHRLKAVAAAASSPLR